MATVEYNHCFNILVATIKSTGYSKLRGQTINTDNIHLILFGSYKEGFEELDLFWTYMTSLVSLNLFCFSIVQILAWFSFFLWNILLLWVVGIISVAFMLFHYQQMIYLLSDPFHSCQLVLLLVWGPEAISWFVCWPNFSKPKLWFILWVNNC